MQPVDPALLKTLVEASPEGVVICSVAADRHWRAVFVNPAMERLTGYDANGIIGRDLRFLQADDHDQEALNKVRGALREGIGCHVLLRNYRRDGALFWNDMTLVPLPTAAGGEVTHFASFHREGGVLSTERAAVADPRDPSMSTQTMLAYLRDDKLTGLLRRSYFEDLLKRDWGLAQRESRRLTFLLFDLDYFDQYREVFGRQGAEQSFRRVARVVGACFRRASDLCGRFDEDQIGALTSGIDLSNAAKLAEVVLGRIRELAIHHPRAGAARYLTASAGVISLVPPQDVPCGKVIDAATQALRDAKDLGRNRVVSREWE
jgi:diguanylate cyclase (GGDEF)-like protein/PAS domain S-box-containing protein